MTADLWAGLDPGAFHPVRNPVTRESGGLFAAVAVMEALGLALCLAAELAEAVPWRRVRQRR